jgi:Zn-dependent protease with chaperone function
MSALIKIEAGQGEDIAWAGSPATAMLFAAPPLPDPAAGGPPWRRVLAAFPSRRPDVAARMARLSSSTINPPAQPPSQPAGGHN